MTQPKAGWEGWDSEFQHWRPPRRPRSPALRSPPIIPLQAGRPALHRQPTTHQVSRRARFGWGWGGFSGTKDSPSPVSGGAWELKLDAVFEELPGIEGKAGDAESVKLHEL